MSIENPWGEGQAVPDWLLPEDSPESFRAAVARLTARVAAPRVWREFSYRGERWSIREATGDDLKAERRELLPAPQFCTFEGRLHVIVARRPLAWWERRQADAK